MRGFVASATELAGLAAITAGVYLLLGLGAAVLVGGVLLVVVAQGVEPKAPREQRFEGAEEDGYTVGPIPIPLLKRRSA